MRLQNVSAFLFQLERERVAITGGANALVMAVFFG
jgi:hypothetical protein